jgi:hypothetical protein
MDKDKKLELAMLTVSRIFAKVLLAEDIVVEWDEFQEEFLFTSAKEEHNEEPEDG